MRDFEIWHMALEKKNHVSFHKASVTKRQIDSHEVFIRAPCQA